MTRNILNRDNMHRTEHSVTEPITVVGAGPSGLAAAIVLAKAGRHVVVREAHETVGTRFHGDYQGLENWSDDRDVMAELSSLGIEPAFDVHPVHEGTAFDAWGKSYTIRGERPLYYLVRRGREENTLDRALLRQALDLGVEVRFRDRVRHVTGSAILAGGPRRADAIAVGYVFKTDMANGNWVVFNNKLAPLAYAYLLVHEGRGTLATCLFTGFKQEQEYLRRTVAFFSERAGLSMREPRQFGGYVNVRIPQNAVQGGHPVVGEQAGFQDALAGFGMRYALRSGALAARSLIENSDYRGLWRRELYPQLWAGVANRFVFNLVGDYGWRWILAHRLDGKDAIPMLRRLYGPNPLTRLVFPIARWRFRTPLRDPSCDHIGCDCVWCRHGEQDAGQKTALGNAESDLAAGW